MAELFNIYCDESCHVERDGVPLMVLGAVWCRAAVVPAISTRIREIKQRHGVPSGVEIKWTKVSKAKQQLYLDLVDYFFDDDDLHFRAIVVQKSGLDHSAFDQTHDTFYYKMCFQMIEPIIDPTQQYHVYLDIKDTRSETKRAKLEEVLRNSRCDFAGQIIGRVQQIRSHESAPMQLADLLLGAVTYRNRGLQTNSAKLAVIGRIQQRSRWSLDRTTWLREPKVNIFFWKGREAGNA